IARSVNSRTRGSVCHVVNVADLNRHPFCNRQLHGCVRQALVTARYRKQRCSRSGTKSICERRSAGDRAVVETFGRAQPPPKEQLVPLRDVDAHLLYQPGRQKAAENQARETREGKERAARAVWEAAPALEEAI